MAEFVQLFFTKSWEFFQIPWPGFSFSIGSVFLAVLISVGALAAFSKMTGVSLLVRLKGPRDHSERGGNNRTIIISKERKGDTR